MGEKRFKALFICLLTLVFLAGCTVRTYTVTKERPDQNLVQGNRGYIGGSAPAVDPDRKTTKEQKVVEIEWRTPIKFERLKNPQENAASVSDELIGYEAPAASYTDQDVVKDSSDAVTSDTRTYKVEKNDTLQKISQKLFGTTKRWNEIYKLNKDKLKSPDKLYSGQTILVPGN